MTRISDALTRARAGSATGPVVDKAADRAPIQFFAPGQPAVVSPWEVREEPEEASPLPTTVRHDELSASGLSRCDPDTAQRMQWPCGAETEKLVVSPDASPLVRAQYSKLAAALHQTQIERGLKVLMLISPGPREGKTMTAANLALTYSEGYRRRVLLIDADLRNPMTHELFGLSNTRGLSDVVADDLPLPLAQVSPTLWVLTAGGPGDGDPTKILTSDRLHRFVQEARGKFDWILIDTPPVALVPDARLLAPLADGALLVAMAGQTAYDQIQSVADTFDAALLLGIVLNRVSEHAWPSAYDSGYYSVDR